MKNILKTFLVVAFLAIAAQATHAQVVMKEYLSTSHEGKIDNSVNNGGKPLYYKLEYKDTQGARINYTLHFYKDAGMSTPWMSFPMLMRNLQLTYYIDVSMPKDNMTKVFAMIYKKELRWARVKYSPHEGCSNVKEIVWERINLVDNFDKLINDTFKQLDKNVNLSCYEKK
ncbi:MAG: hypothetical protein H7Y00_01180 [Fimbriimonadaceae bacterium]|nr:hypothetical protein [Chitinophagales bacterium]